MISTNISGIVTAFPALSELNNERLPAKTAYHVHKLLALIIKDFEHFDQKRVELIKELGKEENGNINVTPENMIEFRTRMQDVLDIEVNVNWTPLRLDELTHPIQGALIGQLGPFIVAE